MKMIGKTAIWGCDIVEVYSIVVNNLVNVKMTHPNDNGKVVTVHVSELQFI
jgi:hypothetical protein